MKIYTLDFDCNQPTAQQVNVPTNTDYKLGVKVKRNGQIQNLSPDSVTLGTLSADAEKTNGYVTFTLSAGDSANYTSEKLAIEKGYDFNDTLSHADGPAVSGNRANFLSAESSAEQLGLAGIEMTIDNIQWGYNTAGTTQLTTTDITQWYEAKTYTGAQWIFFNWPNGQRALAFQGNQNAFAWFSEDGTQAAWVDKVTIDPRWILTFGGNGNGQKTSAGKYWVVAYKFKVGTPWSASFKLNTNVFKSQQGDIADGIESASTAKLTGVYSDGTEFDYDIVIA